MASSRYTTMQGATFVVMLPTSTAPVDVFGAPTIVAAEELATAMYGPQAMVFHARSVGMRRVKDALIRVELADMRERLTMRAGS